MQAYIKALSLLLFAMSASSVCAEEITVICKNSRREYTVKIDTFSKSFVTVTEEGETAYRVDKLKQVGRAYVIDGVAAPGGPSFHALIDNQKLIQFLSANKVFQTDYCRPK